MGKQEAAQVEDFTNKNRLRMLSKLQCKADFLGKNGVVLRLYAHCQQWLSGARQLRKRQSAHGDFAQSHMHQLGYPDKTGRDI